MSRQRALRDLCVALAIVVATLAAGRASANMHFLHPNGRPVGITVVGNVRLHALAGYGETNNFLAWKPLSGDWSNVSNPSGVSSFYMLSSVAGVNAPGFGGPRVFVVSAADTAGSQLWEFIYDSGGVGTWRALGAPSLGRCSVAGNFSNAPYVTAGLDATDSSVWVGVRTSNDGHLWSCHLTTSMGTCTWEDETCATGGSAVSTTTAMAQNNYLRSGVSEREWYAVDTTGHIRRYRWQLDSWDTVPYASAKHVDTTALQAWVNGTSLWVAGMAIDGTSDRLEFATITTTGATWSTFLPPGGATQAPTFNDLAVGVTSGASTAYFSTPSSMWACTWSGTACTWSNPGRAPDQLGSQTVGGGSWGENRTSVFFTGSLGGAEYLFQYAQNKAGAYQWSNHLAPHDAGGVGSLQARNLGEYDSDEYGGTVVFTASAINSPDFPYLCTVGVWRSTDDWNTFSPAATPFGGTNSGTATCTDQTVSFDQAGTPFIAAIHPGESPYSVDIVRWNSVASNWTAAYTILPTSGVTKDRPVLLADRLRTNFLYLMYSIGTGPDGGRMTYCWGDAGHCTADPSGWCSGTSVLPLPSGTGCNGRTESGCWMDQSGDGTVWVAIQGDSACSFRTGYQHVGVRSVTNRASLGSACPQIALSNPECVYYVSYPTSTGVLNGGADKPGNYRRFSARLHASRDNTNRVSIELQSYRDLAGGICTPTSTFCRSEQLFAYRVNGTTGWCGSSCSTSPDPSTMLYLNRDQTGSPLPWVDHILSGIAALDYGLWGATWLDFRSDPTNDHSYNFGTSRVTFDASTNLATSTETPFWPSPNGNFANYVTDGSGSGAWYGDVNRHSNGRGHAHFFDEYASSATQQYTKAYYITWSPSASP